MKSIKLIKVEITKQDGSKTITEVAPDGTLSLATGELARVVTDHHLESLIKVPEGDSLAVVFKDENGVESLIKIDDFFSKLETGDEAPTINITAANIDGQWYASDFMTTPVIAFGSSLSAASDVGDADSNRPLIAAEELDREITRSEVEEALFIPEEDLFISPVTTPDLTIPDPGIPTINVNNIVINEPTIPGAQVTANFFVTLSSPASGVVTVDYQSVSGSAQAGIDFIGVNGTLTFNPGEQVKLVPVQIIGDLPHEGTENFTLILSNPSGDAEIGDGSGIADIIDLPVIIDLSGPSSVDEPDNPGEMVSVDYTVTLSNPSIFPVTVDFSTVDGTATAGSDYTASAGSLTFAPGVTTQTITVQVNGDNLDELDELFSVILSNPSGATIGVGTQNTTITDDPGDAAVVSIDDAASVFEGNSATFTVTLSNPSSGPVTVDFSTVDGTATAGSDYTATAGSLMFAAGETSKTYRSDSAV